METAPSDTTPPAVATVGDGVCSVRALLASTLVAGLLLAGCGGDSRAADDPSGPASTSPAATETPTAAGTEASTPTQVSAPVTEAANTGRKAKPKPKPKPTTTTTTAAPTPTTVPLPQPIAPPADDEAPEPVVPLGTLAIPRIGLERTFYEGIRIPTFDLGPGHWPGSAMPGQPGNMVIGGHRTERNEDFRYLDQLASGDEMIIITNEGTRFTYVVESVEITDPFAAKVVYQTPQKTATLFACHPPGSVRQRIVVHLALAA